MRAHSRLTASFGLAFAALAAGGIAARAQEPNAGLPLMKQQIPAQTPDSDSAPAVGAGRGVAFTMGEIGRRAAYGQDGSWLTTASGDGSLVFANSGNPAGWNATIIEPPRFPYTAQVEVNSGITPAPGHAVGAGITFAYQRSKDPKQRSFYAVLLVGDTVYAYRYDGGSFSQIVHNTNTDLDGGGRRWNTLSVSVRQDGFALALNGEEFTSMSADGSLIGDVGVMVSGAGDASFRNLELQSGQPVPGGLSGSDQQGFGAPPAQQSPGASQPQPGFAMAQPGQPGFGAPPQSEQPMQPARQNYADELTDFGVPPRDQLQPNVGSPTPVTIPGGHVITTNEMRQAMGNSAILFVDVLAGRPHPEIPGAIWLPGAGQAGTFHDDTQQKLWSVLSQATHMNPDQPIAFFCMGSRCWESYNAALRAERLGFKMVLWYRGGLSAWQTAGLPMTSPDQGGGAPSQGGGIGFGRGSQRQGRGPDRGAADAAMLAGGETRINTAQNGKMWRLKRIEQSADVNDPVTGQPMHVKIMNMLLPMDWKLLSVGLKPDGKVDCANNLGRLSITAASPDLSTGIVVIPTSASMWSNNQNLLANVAAFDRQWSAFSCVVEKPMTLQEGLSLVAPRLIAGAQVQGNLQPVPGLSENLPQIVAGANRQLMGRAQLDAEAGRLRVAGNLNGKQVEAWLIALQTRRTEPAPGGGQLMTNDIPMFAVAYAPPGQLDGNDKLLSTILSSIQVDPQHTAAMQRAVINLYQTINGAYAQVAQIQQQMAADNARAAQQQAAIRADAANYVSRVRSNVAQSRAAALDHSSQQFALYMGDQAIYRDPSTGERVQMSSGYNHVWASSTGNTNEYILTDSHSFDPNGQVGAGSWVQMQEVR